MTSNNEESPDKTPSKRTISDAGLSQLREQVKSIMIPLLIKIFHLKIEAQQASSPPSRLMSSEPEGKIVDVCHQLEGLDEDLKLMIGWCQSSRNQIQKVLQEINQELKPPSSITGSFSETNPNVQKSFVDALATQKEYIKKIKDSHQRSKPLVAKTELSSEKSQSSWWLRIFKH